ncbi:MULTISPECIES: GNAT family N-acetyltransferase [unclassified Flavobacterium]|uniref:GNAT family N-acetyltransferase n=1 Tax=unclassified Flavobacterium TaxID=196869 RepID=UPI0021047D74|nr:MULTISPECIES: GNAT family N-acetyltransferase [unclassified Flavobacterium]
MEYFNQETERVILRKLTMSDVEKWTGFFVDNQMLKYVGIDMSKSPSTLATDWISKQLERYENQGLGHLAAIEKNSGEFIGVSGIIPREVDGKAEMEISYSLKQEFWGKGFATEISTQLKKFGLENNISNQFVSIIDKENTASINVAIKNGMKILSETKYLGMDVFILG